MTPVGTPSILPSHMLSQSTWLLGDPSSAPPRPCQSWPAQMPPLHLLCGPVFLKPDSAEAQSIFSPGIHPLGEIPPAAPRLSPTSSSTLLLPLHRSALLNLDMFILLLGLVLFFLLCIAGRSMVFYIFFFFCLFHLASSQLYDDLRHLNTGMCFRDSGSLRMLLSELAVPTWEPGQDWCHWP